jgi:fucose 4-O-acetylase-like acetyltransferase
MNEKVRIVWIDEMKGFSILLMVMGHAIAGTYRDNQIFFVEDGGGIIFNFIYSFHMYLLFFISAYTSYKKEIYSLTVMAHRIVGKFERLMLPYFFTGFLMLVTRGVYGYWFLLTLFEFYFVYYLLFGLSQIINKKQNVFLECIIFIIPYFISVFLSRVYNFQILNFIGIGQFYTYYPFFILGIFSQKYKLLEKTIYKDLFFCIDTTLFFILFTINSKLTFGVSISYMIRNLTSLCAIISCVYLFKNKIIDDERIQIIFSHLGKNMLGIYIFHNFFVMRIYEIGDFVSTQTDILTGMTLQTILSFLNALTAIILSLICIKIVHASKILSYLLFGEKIIPLPPPPP